MITISIEPNTITPFVESEQIIEFIVDSKYYVPAKFPVLYDKNNNKKIRQITTRTTQLNQNDQNKYIYGFSISLLPELNEISQPKSKLFTNDPYVCEKFNNFTFKFIDPLILEWEERRFYERNYTHQYIHNTDELNFDSLQKYEDVEKVLSIKNLRKKTSIKNLRNIEILSLNDYLKIQFSKNKFIFRPFNDSFIDYNLPTTYNYSSSFWENKGLLRILYNYWEKILFDLTDAERESMISKLLYPINTNDSIHDSSFIGYLDPFMLREIINYSINSKETITGLKCSIQKIDKSIIQNNAAMESFINLNQTNPVNYFLDVDEKFADDTLNNQLTIFTKYKFEKIKKNPETNSIFDLNGQFTNKKMTVIKEIVNNKRKQIQQELLNFNYANEKVESTIIPFKEEDFTLKFIEKYNNVVYKDDIKYTNNFYSDIIDNNILDQSIIDQLANRLFNTRNVILFNEAIQYSAGGYNIDKSNNVLGIDSINYIGIKE